MINKKGKCKMKKSGKKWKKEEKKKKKDWSRLDLYERD
jgi:hypothetical protein